MQDGEMTVWKTDEQGTDLGAILKLTLERGAIEIRHGIKTYYLMAPEPEIPEGPFLSDEDAEDAFQLMMGVPPELLRRESRFENGENVVKFPVEPTDA